MKSMNKSYNIGFCEGDHLKLTWSPSNNGEKNAYIGFEGVVKIDNKKEGKFSLFSGKSWLTNLSVSDDRFKIIKKNTSGLFKINNTAYYSKESVLHKPVKCCECKFIPVEYMIRGFFYNRAYCFNCIK